MIRAILFLSFLTFLTACGSDSYEEKLIGTWNVSSHISSGIIKSVSVKPFPNDIDMDITISGSTTYHKGGKLSEQGETILRLKRGGGEVALRFFTRSSGTWEVHDDTLVSTSIDSITTPLDGETKKIVEEVPVWNNIIASIKGETMSFKIISISKTEAQMEILGPPNIPIAMKRKITPNEEKVALPLKVRVYYNLEKFKIRNEGECDIHNLEMWTLPPNASFFQRITRSSSFQTELETLAKSKKVRLKFGELINAEGKKLDSTYVVDMLNFKGNYCGETRRLTLKVRR